MVEKVKLSGEIIAIGKSRTRFKETKVDFVSVREDDGQVTNVEEVRAIGPIAAYVTVGTKGEFSFLEKGPRIPYGVRLEDGTVAAIERWSRALVWFGVVWSVCAIFILIGLLTLPWGLWSLYRVHRMNRVLDEEFGGSTVPDPTERIMKPRTI